MSKTKFIIFITGLPASSKTTFSEFLSKKLRVLCINKNYVKEILSEFVGFANRIENQKLSTATYQLMRHIAKNSMKIGVPIMLEKSFFDTDDAIYFSNAIKKYNYKAITVIFTGDRDVLYERYQNRQKVRHHAHQSLEVTREFFKNMPEGWEHFDMGGEKLVVDTTDFSKVCYEKIAVKIEAILPQVISCGYCK